MICILQSTCIFITLFYLSDFCGKSFYFLLIQRDETSKNTFCRHQWLPLLLLLLLTFSILTTLFSSKIFIFLNYSNFFFVGNCNCEKIHYIRLRRLNLYNENYSHVYPSFFWVTLLLFTFLKVIFYFVRQLYFNIIFIVIFWLDIFVQ